MSRPFPMGSIWAIRFRDGSLMRFPTDVEAYEYYADNQ